jgi:hypothetical protein
VAGQTRSSRTAKCHVTEAVKILARSSIAKTPTNENGRFVHMDISNVAPRNPGNLLTAVFMPQMGIAAPLDASTVSADRNAVTASVRCKHSVSTTLARIAFISMLSDILVQRYNFDHLPNLRSSVSRNHGKDYNEIPTTDASTLLRGIGKSPSSRSLELSVPMDT